MATKWTLAGVRLVVPNAKEKKVTMQTGYFNAAWQDIKNSPGWFGKLVLLSLLSLIPIFGWLVVLGYLYGWARDIAWNVHFTLLTHLRQRGRQAVQPRLLRDGHRLRVHAGAVDPRSGVGCHHRHGHRLVGTGARRLFMFVGLSTMISSLLIIAASFFATLFSWVAPCA